MIYLDASLVFLVIIGIIAAIYYYNSTRANALPVKLVDKNESVAIWIVSSRANRFWIKVVFNNGQRPPKFIGPYRTFNEAWDMGSRIDIRGIGTPGF